MTIKNMVKKALTAGTVLCGLAMPAKADDITLSYDYIQNARHAPLIERGDGNLDGFDADKQILDSENHANFLDRANQAGLSTDDRLSLLGHLGGIAGENYDYSMPFEEVSLDRIFTGIQTNVDTGETTPSGATCGGIHNFVRESAQGLGFDAVTYSGRMGVEGNGHIFASVLTDDGFVTINYDKLVRTRTFNFYRALALAQQDEGSTELVHYVYDDRLLFRHITPDGQRFFRFVQVDPSLDAFIRATENGAPFDPGAHIVLGNAELSAAYEFRPFERAPFSLTCKAGAIFGQPNGALDRADLFEALARWNIDLGGSELDANLDLRSGLVYGRFHQARTQDSLIALTDGRLSLARNLSADQRVKLDLRGVFSVDLLGTDNRQGTTGIVHLFDGSAMLSYEDGIFNPYAAVQLIGGVNNVEEQEPMMHLGDVEAGILLRTPFATLRTAGRIAPEALVARLGIETDRFGLDLRYGLGRQGAFTPDFIEADAHGRIMLRDVMPQHPLADRSSLEGKICVRHERWSHGEENNQGTVQLRLQIDF